jgi:hypothetical protein
MTTTTRILHPLPPAIRASLVTIAPASAVP